MQTTTCTRVRASRMLSQTTSTPRKAAKRGRKPKSSSPSDFCRICYTLCASDTIEKLHSISKHVSEFCIKKALHCILKTSCLVFRFSNQQKQIVLCWQNDRRNPKLFHLFYLFQHSHICILLLLHRVNSGFANTPDLAYVTPKLFRWLHWGYGGRHFDSRKFQSQTQFLFLPFSQQMQFTLIVNVVNLN